MDSTQFADLMARENPSRYIHAEHFTGPDRTLLYGYTCDRHTFHVYLQDGWIHRITYTGTLDHSLIRHDAMADWWAFNLIPDKRVYPERTDIDFARMLQVTGARVPYLTFDPERYERAKDTLMHGKTYADLTTYP